MKNKNLEKEKYTEIDYPVNKQIYGICARCGRKMMPMKNVRVILLKNRFAFRYLGECINCGITIFSTANKEDAEKYEQIIYEQAQNEK